MFPAALSVLGAAAIQERPLKPSFYCSFFCMFETLKFGSHRNFLAANKETIRQADFRELSSESTLTPEVEFVHPVSPGGSVKFVASGVNFSIFTNFLCFFLLKLLKLGEIGGVKFLT